MQRVTQRDWKQTFFRIMLVLAGLGLWFLTQSLIGRRGDLEGDYDVANDFFFSGHTGIAVYGGVEIGRLNGRKGILMGTAIAVFEVASVLVLRAHYTMDVLTGVLAALFVAGAVSRIAPGLDRQIERICTQNEL